MKETFYICFSDHLLRGLLRIIYKSCIFCIELLKPLVIQGLRSIQMMLFLYFRVLFVFLSFPCKPLRSLWLRKTVLTVSRLPAGHYGLHRKEGERSPFACNLSAPPGGGASRQRGAGGSLYNNIMMPHLRFL